MNVIAIVLLLIAALVSLLLVLAVFMRRNHYVKREILIKAEPQKVFDYIRRIENEETFNVHAKAGSERKKHFTGTDGTEGFIYAWSGGKDVGQGEKEIIRIVDGQSIETEIRFVRPMKTRATVIMEIKPETDGSTRLSWSNAGKLPYPLNLLIPTLEKSVAKSMETSLLTLKNILEK